MSGGIEPFIFMFSRKKADVGGCNVSVQSDLTAAGKCLFGFFLNNLGQIKDRKRESKTKVREKVLFSP